MHLLSHKIANHTKTQEQQQQQQTRTSTKKMAEITNMEMIFEKKQNHQEQNEHQRRRRSTFRIPSFIHMNFKLIEDELKSFGSVSTEDLTLDDDSLNSRLGEHQQEDIHKSEQEEEEEETVDDDDDEEEEESHATRDYMHAALVEHVNYLQERNETLEQSNQNLSNEVAQMHTFLNTALQHIMTLESTVAKLQQEQETTNRLMMERLAALENKDRQGGNVPSRNESRPTYNNHSDNLVSQVRRNKPTSSSQRGKQTNPMQVPQTNRWLTGLLQNLPTKPQQ